MKEVIIEISKLLPGRPAVHTLGEIHKNILDASCDMLVIDLTGYEYINPCFASIIASSIYVGKQYDKKVVLRYSKGNEKVMEFLKRSGIIYHYQNNDNSELNSKNSDVQFNRYKTLDEAFPTIDKILDSTPVKLTQELRDVLFSKISEVFSNAFTHSESEIGVFCCGFMNSSKIFSFSVYDAGIGICKNVNNYLHKDMDCSDSLRWAFKKGNSTLNGMVDYPRGAGLHLLESFVKANNGQIELISQGGYCRVNAKKRNFYNLENPIIGTVFSMSINTDLKHIYNLKSNI